MSALSGKVALITGAGQGLGRAHALHLASLGAAVVANDLGDGAATVAEEIIRAGGKAVAVSGSVTDSDAVEAMFSTAANSLGVIDIVVNNAGFLRDAMTVSMTEQQFDAVVDVHLKGHWTVNREAAGRWREASKNGDNRPRRIINTASESGIYGGPGQSNYGAAKGGIIAMTYIMAKELGRYGVTVNCIAPRARTTMTEANPRFAKPDEGFDRYHPDNVSRVVAWPMSAATSSFATAARCISCDRQSPSLRHSTMAPGHSTHSTPPRMRCSPLSSEPFRRGAGRSDEHHCPDAGRSIGRRQHRLEIRRPADQLA
jgi:NAD(P)-dependent dehydrogenase (short-subunit alcohol dehydrogenase family)